jgi:type VI secretion system secreted protein Hcp
MRHWQLNCIFLEQDWGLFALCFLNFYDDQGGLKSMAFDAFLKIDGVDGESTDEKHTGWIEIVRFGIGVLQEVSATASSSGGAGAERTDFSDFIVRKLLDKTSPKLALACAAGTHINKIVVELCRSGTDNQPYMVYTMQNCIISRVITTRGDDVGGFPAETIRINFGRIEYRYIQIDRKTGVPMGNVAGGWDLQRNCRI